MLSEISFCALCKHKQQCFKCLSAEALLLMLLTLVFKTAEVLSHLVGVTLL